MGLLERDACLDVLDIALQDAIGGEGRVTLVSGEAGIGKTSLVAWFTRERCGSVRVLWGACDALFTPRPLGPLHDMAVQMQGNVLALLNSDANRTAIFSAVLSALQGRPAIVVCEDVHWADEATLDLLRFLGRRMARTVALLVMTYRDDELGPQHPLRTVLGDLATLPVTRRVPLPPLTETAVRTLVGERAIAAAALHRQTGGNPFFVTEVLASVGGALPPSIRDAGLEFWLANMYSNLGSGSGELYQFHRAERFLADGIAYATEHDLDTFRLYMLAWQTLTHVHLGRWRDATTMGTEVLKRPSASVMSRLTVWVALGRLRARRGDPGVSTALDEALELATRADNMQRLGPVRAARAEAAWLAGDRERTVHEARAVYDLAVRKQHPWITGELAFWRWRAGDTVAPPDWIATPFAFHLAGDWRAAAVAWERLGCPYEHARALADGDAAAQTAALTIFARLGAQPAAADVRQRMQVAGLHNIPRGPRPATRDNPFNLTARQMDILALLVEDLTNAEIAARLYISPKTVDHHVSAVLAKLNMHTRQAAAA